MGPRLGYHATRLGSRDTLFVILESDFAILLVCHGAARHVRKGLFQGLTLEDPRRPSYIGRRSILLARGRQQRPMLVMLAVRYFAMRWWEITLITTTTMYPGFRSQIGTLRYISHERYLNRRRRCVKLFI